jgi:hypothetical protein
MSFNKPETGKLETETIKPEPETGKPETGKPETIKPETETGKPETHNMGGKYIFEDLMDDVNKKAMNVFTTKGIDAAVEYMFTDQETGRQLSYGEMRARYG